MQTKRRNLKIGFVLQFIISGAPLMADLFIPQFAETLGATRFEIGILGTAFALSMFISSAFFGRISDKLGRKKIISLGFISAILFYTVSFFSASFPNFFALRIFQGISIGIYPGALAAYVNENSGTMDDYTAWGALGIAFFLGLSSVIATLSFDIPLFPKAIIKKNINLYLAIFFTFSGITVTWTYWILFLNELGATPLMVGCITIMNPLSEFLMLKFVAHRIKWRSTGFGILILSLAFPLFVLAKHPWQIMPLQALTGIGWAFMYAGGLNEIMEKNEETGTATGILHSAVSLGSITGPFIASLIILIFKSLKYEFIFAGLIIFIGFIIISKEKRQKINPS
jgi:MFS family permease